MRDEELMRATQFRKSISDRKTLEAKALKALKYDFQKAAKDYIVATEKKKQKADFILHTWTSVIFLTNLCASIENYYQKQKAMNEKKRRIYNAFCLLIEKGGQKMRKKGEKARDRLIFDIHM